MTYHQYKYDTSECCIINLATFANKSRKQRTIFRLRIRFCAQTCIFLMNKSRKDEISTSQLTGLYKERSDQLTYLLELRGCIVRIQMKVQITADNLSNHVYNYFNFKQVTLPKFKIWAVWHLSTTKEHDIGNIQHDNNSSTSIVFFYLSLLNEH